MKAIELFEHSKRLPPNQQTAYLARELPSVLIGTIVTMWDPEQGVPSSGRYTLIGIAPYSKSDLQLLDAIVKFMSEESAAHEKVEIFDILSCSNMDDIQIRVPGIGRVFQTPVVGIWDNGKLGYKASGAEGHRLIVGQFNLQTSAA